MIHKILLDMGQHPTLRQHYENAMKVYEYYSEKALKCHQDGVYRIDLGDIFSSFFVGGFSSRSSKKAVPQKGADLRMQVEISFEDSSA